MADPKLNKVAVFMFKDSVADLPDAVTEKFDVGGVVIREGLSEQDYSGEVYYDELISRKTQDNVPWIGFLNDGTEDAGFTLEAINTFPRGMLLARVKVEDVDRYFAVTFGMHSQSWIDKSQIVSDFGIRVAMNICDPEKLKRVQTTTHESITKQTEMQLSSGAHLGIFDIDDHTDFLRTIAGEARDDIALIESFRGKESIVLKLDDALDWGALIDLCATLAEKYDADTYKETFPMYDRFRFETDPIVIQGLDDEIVERFKAKDFEKVHLAIPSFFDFDRYSISYDNGEDATRYPDLEISQVEDHLQIREGFSVDSLKRKRIWQYDHENDRFQPTGWNLYKCIVAEVDDAGKTYVLSDGRWKIVSQEFADEVNDYISDNVSMNNSVSFRDGINIFDKRLNKNMEAVFNAVSADEIAEIICLDKSKFPIAGERRYEVCDLIGEAKLLIHVKRYSSGSASISHLFTQARFYADAFVSDDQCRSEMRKFLEDEGHRDFLDAVPDDRSELHEHEYTVAFCILIDEDTNFNDVSDLPFMAKYELMQTHRYLTNNRNFKVEACLIGVTTGPG